MAHPLTSRIRGHFPSEISPKKVPSALGPTLYWYLVQRDLTMGECGDGWPQERPETAANLVAK